MTETQILVIPAFNPPSVLSQIVDQVQPFFTQIIIVDDGSGESSRGIFAELEQVSNVRILTHKHNCGKGTALKTALKAVLSLPDKYDVVTADADGQHLPEDIIKLADALSGSHNAVVIGTRDFSTAPWRNRMGNVLAAWVFYLFTGRKQVDTQTGLRGIPASFISEIVEFPEKGYDFEARMLLAAVRHKYQITEVPISAVYHDDGISHFRPCRDSGKIALCAIKELCRYSGNCMK